MSYTKHTQPITTKTGSVIHWDLPRIKNQVQVTCGSCKQLRLCQVTSAHNSSGLCLPCSNKTLAKVGEDHHLWKGGKTVDNDGYLLIHKSLLPLGEQTQFQEMFTHSGYILEHRLIAARTLGRNLFSNEKVHHLNALKQDNRPSNLKVLSATNHAQEHLGWIAALRAEILRLQGLLDNAGVVY